MTANVVLTTLTIAAIITSHPKVIINKSAAFCFRGIVRLQILGAMKKISHASVTILHIELTKNIGVVLMHLGFAE